MKTAVNVLEMSRNRYDYRYTLENFTGEEVLISTTEGGEFIRVYPNHVFELDFDQTIAKSSDTKRGWAKKIKENFKINQASTQKNKKIYVRIPTLDSKAFEETMHLITIDFYELQKQKSMKIHFGESKEFYML